jgi:hypothetical protein
MEKVIIKTCVKKETQKGVFYTIELSDGRKGISSTDLTSQMGMEAELDVKDGTPYNGVMQYYFNLPKAQGQSNGGGKFPAKDWSFEKRRSALENAVNHCNKNTALTTAQVLECATKFFEFLNTK